MDFVNETAKLTINDAYVEDTGDYSCEIWNEVGQTDSAFHITIKEKKGKPKRTRTAPSTPRPSIPNIQVDAAKQPEDVYETEGPKKAIRKNSAAADKDRKISQPSGKLDMIDESGSKYNFFTVFNLFNILKFFHQVEIASTNFFFPN